MTFLHGASASPKGPRQPGARGRFSRLSPAPTQLLSPNPLGNLCKISRSVPSLGTAPAGHCCRRQPGTEPVLTRSPGAAEAAGPLRPSPLPARPARPPRSAPCMSPPARSPGLGPPAGAPLRPRLPPPPPCLREKRRGSAAQAVTAPPRPPPPPAPAARPARTAAAILARRPQGAARPARAALWHLGAGLEKEAGLNAGPGWGYGPRGRG